MRTKVFTLLIVTALVVCAPGLAQSAGIELMQNTDLRTMAGWSASKS